MVELPFNDIYGMHYVPFWYKSWFLYGVLTIAVLFCVIMVRMLWKWYCTRYADQPFSKRSLNELLQMHAMIEAGGDIDGRVLYRQLITMIKAILSHLFCINYSVKTDLEMVDEINRLPLEPGDKDILNDLMMKSEAIKFGAAHVDMQIAKKDIAHLIDLSKKLFSTINTKK